MFYNLIKRKRDEWLGSKSCTVRSLVDYIEGQGLMRDAQVDAIKTYLYLKIACGNAPLWRLLSAGVFNSLDLYQQPVPSALREALSENKAAAALFEYSKSEDRNGRQLAPRLEEFISGHVDEIDYVKAFKEILYNEDYTDYLFSLPMGAGKTYLMAAFIYLDLYFACASPADSRFAHNFIIFAPSGLKSSIVPSLRHIREFDPSWIIPEPDASRLRRMMKFEILDEQKEANDSNRVRNPNACKISIYQPFDSLMGLVAVTNAEKVILDRVGKEVDDSLFSREENRRIEVANELRDIIGRLPNLAIYIDEVHHAAADDIRLRQVVNAWTSGNTITGVLGFSGTPYLEKAKTVTLLDTFSIKSNDISTVVSHYPLIQGIGNFLKVPVVKYADNDTATIVRNGVNDFLRHYRDTVYGNGTCAKLAIYCGQIETLEEVVYPLVSELVMSFGMEPSETILKYHRGNARYPQPAGSELEFMSLDSELSRKRIILLVQIGKEGWDCKSLTGVILPQKGACNTNMVLQTSCRCLRQVVRNERETALIWLNKFNADTLNRQLRQAYDISIQELNDVRQPEPVSVNRYSRMAKLNVPPIEYYQFRVTYPAFFISGQPDAAARLADKDICGRHDATLVYEQDLAGTHHSIHEGERDGIAVAANIITFSQWTDLIVRESFNTLPASELKKHEARLREIFDEITLSRDGITYLDTRFDQEGIRSRIRLAFVPRRDFRENEEMVFDSEVLLDEEKLDSPHETSDAGKYYPS